MRVRVRASGMVRLLVLCGLIAELTLIPGVTAGRSAIARAAGVMAAPGRPTARPATVPVAAGVVASARRLAGSLPLAFEPNVGQADRRVRYLARGAGYTLFLTAGDATLTHDQERGLTPHGRAGANDASAGVVVHLAPVGANPRAYPEAVRARRLPGYVNYIVGRDPRGWHTHIPTYAAIAYRGIYPGVDLVYYGVAGRLEYDFQLAPGADPGRIRFAVSALTPTARRGWSAALARLDARGDLVLRTAAGDVTQRTPVVYQEVAGQRRAVAARYRQAGAGDVGLALGRYDHDKPLVVDPVVLYATYLGGSTGEAAYGVAVDGAGAMYLAGNTGSVDYPTVNAYQSTLKGTNGCFGVACVDAVLSKLSPDGHTLLYSTYFGGNGSETGNALRVDAAGDAYIVGTTQSSDLPVPGGYQTTYGGGGCFPPHRQR